MMQVNREILTLDEFTIKEMRTFPEATGDKHLKNHANLQIRE